MVIVAYMFPETANWVTAASEYVPSDTLHLPVLIPPSKKDHTRRHQLRDLIEVTRIKTLECREPGSGSAVLLLWAFVLPLSPVVVILNLY